MLGPALFSRSGFVIIQSGKRSATVTGISLSVNSLVLAMLQNVAGGVLVKAVVPDYHNSRFTIVLDKATQTTAKVGWFIVN